MCNVLQRKAAQQQLNSRELIIYYSINNSQQAQQGELGGRLERARVVTAHHCTHTQRHQPHTSHTPLTE
jgi:hypothetical protein